MKGEKNKIPKVFTHNEAMELMHENLAMGLNAIADYIEKYDLDEAQIIALVRECADEVSAQAIVVKLRDEINK